MKGRLRSGSKSKDSTINQNQYIDWADFVKKIQQLESRISETNAEKLSQELLSILENQLSLINYRETKIGSNFAHAILRSIRRILFYLDNKIQDRAIFQKATNLIFLVRKYFFFQSHLKRSSKIIESNTQSTIKVHLIVQKFHEMACITQQVFSIHLFIYSLISR